MNFKFQSHDEYANDKTVKSFDADHLEDILEQFQLFLAGVGFVYEGNLEFVHQETDAPDVDYDAWKWTVNELKRTGTVMDPPGGSGGGHAASLNRRTDAN